MNDFKHVFWNSMILKKLGIQVKSQNNASGSEK